MYTHVWCSNTYIDVYILAVILSATVAKGPKPARPSLSVTFSFDLSLLTPQRFPHPHVIRAPDPHGNGLAFTSTTIPTKCYNMDIFHNPMYDGSHSYGRG